MSFQSYIDMAGPEGAAPPRAARPLESHVDAQPAQQVGWSFGLFHGEVFPSSI
jgi:hypothetical protein